MKKIFLLFFCFISSFVFSQEIFFDYILEKETIIGEKHTSFQFYNSKTQHFFAVKRNNQKFIGSLYDIEKKLLHYFYIYEIDGKFNAVYSDSYIHNSSIEVNDKNNLSENHNNMEIHKIEDLHYNVSLFHKNKSKKGSTSIDVKLEKSDFNYFQINFESPDSYSISSILENAVNKNGCCYRISKYNIIYKKKIEVSVINRFKKVDLKLVIPDKLNIKYLQSSTSR